MTIFFPSVVSWFRQLSSTRQTLLIIFGLCSGLLFLSWVSLLPTHPIISPSTAIHSPNPASKNQEMEAELKTQWGRIRENSRVPPMASSSPGAMPSPGGDIGGFETPLIAHAADLEVTTKEFAKSRSSLEEILERHHGYAAKLRMVGQPAGSLLTATLRVPSSEFSAAVTDLKALGNVEHEEQTADEITQQRAELEARLTNAQRSLASLQGILSKGGKVGKVKDLADVQRQLANVNAEIARLEAERVAAEHRVIFAQVLFSLREVIAPPAETLASQFRNAAVMGFSDVLSTLTAITIFVISRGPAILLWVVVFYFPLRWAWRKWRLAPGPRTGIAQGV